MAQILVCKLVGWPVASRSRTKYIRNRSPTHPGGDMTYDISIKSNRILGGG